MSENITQRDSSGWQKLPQQWPEALRRVLAARGIQTETDLIYKLADLPKPELMMGMVEAVDLLVEAVTQQWRIMIVADFDADGATSCVVAMRSLQMMGADYVDYIVPNRFKHGYGLTPELLADIPSEQQPDLLITVDNGIASISGVAAAHKRGMKVLVTDHHLPGELLPKADAIVNPNQHGDEFPSKNLAGVGVCFYLMLALRKRLRQQKWFHNKNLTEPKLNILLDLVALGTVADVVPLDKLNRTLVSLGLARIRANMACPGIAALIKVAGRNVTSLAAADLGFSVAPRLNASGRLEDMRTGINTLLSTDITSADQQAQVLDDINKQRRNVEQEMQDDALEMLQQMSFDNDNPPLGYCLYNEQWHQGVIGLLASRIKERQHRPVIAFAPGQEGEIKGSARSIPGVHIRDVLALVSSQAPEVLTKFGGHAMAAGLTIAKNDMARFEELFLDALKQTVEPNVLHKELLSDGELIVDEISLGLAEQLSLVAPWGQAFPEPQFHGEFVIKECRMIGQQYDHLRLTIDMGNGKLITAMAFRQQQPDWLKLGAKALIRYRLAVNEFRQQRTVQLLVDNLLPVA
ncbi:MAG: single-stranded-DNA-specific exonuclease RecJ [Piscirickettsiaceae bacterium]|nr:single-stranded-DNA-specific exonuclease RecJ [Piscirickettsiaceae bacterium]